MANWRRRASRGPRACAPPPPLILISLFRARLFSRVRGDGVPPVCCLMLIRRGYGIFINPPVLRWGFHWGRGRPFSVPPGRATGTRRTFGAAAGCERANVETQQILQEQTDLETPRRSKGYADVTHKFRDFSPIFYCHLHSSHHLTCQSRSSHEPAFSNESILPSRVTNLVQSKHLTVSGP